MKDIKLELGKDFEKAILAQAREAMADMEFDYECPECGNSMRIKAGEARACPSCGFVIEAQLS